MQSCPRSRSVHIQAGIRQVKGAFGEDRTDQPKTCFLFAWKQCSQLAKLFVRPCMSCVLILPACSGYPCIQAGFPYSMLGFFGGKVRKRGCAITHDLNFVSFDNRCVSSSSYVPQMH